VVDRETGLPKSASLPHLENVMQQAFQALRERGEQVPANGSWSVVMREHWWDLARLGVIALPGEAFIGHARDQWEPIITERGRDFLAAGRVAIEPRDRARFLGDLERRGGPVDAITRAYIDEAIGAWEVHLYRASTVMQGCAVEHLVLQLARALAELTTIAGAAKVRKILGEERGVSPLFDAVQAALAELDYAGLLGPLGEAWDRDLAAVFDRARRLRNRAGHPTGEEVSAGDAEAGLLLFPGFYERMVNLTAHIRGLTLDTV
jgi:hypothetical protein